MEEKYWLNPDFWNENLQTDKGGIVAELIDPFFSGELQLGFPIKNLAEDILKILEFFGDVEEVEVWPLSIEGQQISELFEVSLLYKFWEAVSELFQGELRKMENVSKLTYIFDVFDKTCLYPKMRREIDSFISLYYDRTTVGYPNFVDLLCMNSYFLITHHVYCIVKGFEMLGEKFKFLTDCLKAGNYPIGMFDEERNLFLLLTQ